MDFSLVSDPLISVVITFYTLILLYLPTTLFFRIVFSPIIISTSVILFSLLRLGAYQRSRFIEDPERVLSEIKEEIEKGSENAEFKSECESKKKNKLFYCDSFVEWDVRAPLEVIYEEYEGEIEEDDINDGVLEGKRDAHMGIIEKYASVSKFYPETDSDVSSEEDSFGISDWDFQLEKEEKEGLIEIELGHKRYYCGGGGEVEEDDNLIEIDLYPVMEISPAR